jgi:hypothetical protein
VYNCARVQQFFWLGLTAGVEMALGAGIHSWYGGADAT